MALSPDGLRLAFNARGPDGKFQIWIRQLDSLEARPLAGTEGATCVFWSPDSRWIAFGADGKLKKIETVAKSCGIDPDILISALALPDGKYKTEQIKAVLAELDADDKADIKLEIVSKY